MKILNSKKSGFEATVDVYDEKIYVNTNTGEGYDKVIKKLDKLIGFLAMKYRLQGFTYDDCRQHVVVHILEGISKFNPDKGTKLSTFIQMMVSRRLINELRDENISSKSATFLNITSYSCACKCGRNNIAIVAGKDNIAGACDNCGANIADARRIVRVNQPEASLSEVMMRSSEDNIFQHDCTHHSLELSDRNMFLQALNDKKSADEQVISSHDINKWLSNEDPVVAKLIELVCFNDYSLKDAAEEVGISRAWADVKMRQLKNKKIVKEILDKNEKNY